MTTYVALLYSIVLGPGRPRHHVRICAQRQSALACAHREHWSRPEIWFSIPIRTAFPRWRPRWNVAFAEDFGKHVDIIVRTAQDWLALDAGNPFCAVSDVEAQNIVVRVMRAPLPEGYACHAQKPCGWR